MALYILITILSETGIESNNPTYGSQVMRLPLLKSGIIQQVWYAMTVDTSNLQCTFCRQ